MIKRAIGCLVLVLSVGVGAGAWAQPVDHLGGKFFAPFMYGVQQGAHSIGFVPGGTVFQNPNGSIVTVPTQVFTPYPLNSQDFRQLTLPALPPLQTFDPDPNIADLVHWRIVNEATSRFASRYEAEGMDPQDARRQAERRGGYVHDIDFGSADEALGRGVTPPVGRFNPVPPSDMPTPSYEGVREEIL